MQPLCKWCLQYSLNLTGTFWKLFRNQHFRQKKRRVCGSTEVNEPQESIRKTSNDIERGWLYGKYNWSGQGWIKKKGIRMAGFLIPINWAPRTSKGWAWVDWWSGDKSLHKCAPLTGFAARPAKFIHQSCVYNSPGGYQTNGNEMNDEACSAHSPAPSTIDRGTCSPFVRVGLLFWLLLARFGHHDFFFGAVRLIACRIAAWSVSRFVAPLSSEWESLVMSRDLYWEVNSDWLLGETKKCITNRWTEKPLTIE